MVDVFISYSREDKERIERFARAIEAAGYRVWWDRDLPPHKSYDEVIGERIDAAKAVIVVWSPGAASSHWVRAEASRALDARKLVQASLEGTMPPLPFNLIHSVPLDGWRGEPDHPEWRKVLASLADLCGGEAAPRPPTASSPPTPRASARKGPAVAAAAIAIVALAGGAVLLWAAGDGEPAIEQAEAPAETPEAEQTARSAEPARERPIDLTVAAVIDDPEGYTNIRDAPRADARIVARVAADERFMAEPGPGDWWLVRTAEGETGYMSRSRIRLLGASEGG